MTEDRLAEIREWLSGFDPAEEEDDDSIAAWVRWLCDEVERLRVELARAKDPSVMSVLLWESFRENELKDVEAERDAALAEVERLRTPTERSKAFRLPGRSTEAGTR